MAKRLRLRFKRKRKFAFKRNFKRRNTIGFNGFLGEKSMTYKFRIPYRIIMHIDNLSANGSYMFDNHSTNIELISLLVADQNFLNQMSSYEYVQVKSIAVELTTSSNTTVLNNTLGTANSRILEIPPLSVSIDFSQLNPGVPVNNYKYLDNAVVLQPLQTSPIPVRKFYTIPLIQAMNDNLTALTGILGSCWMDANDLQGSVALGLGPVIFANLGMAKLFDVNPPLAGGNQIDLPLCEATFTFYTRWAKRI